MPPDSGGRDTILDTSAKLFNQYGYKEVSIRDIAQACGMTNAALYYHFKNKEDLFLAMLQRDHERNLQSLQEAANGPGDLREDLKQLITVYARLACQRRQTFQTVKRDLHNLENARAHKLFVEMRDSFMHPLEDRLAQAQVDGEIKPGDVHLYARLLHGFIIALTLDSRQDKQRKVPAQDVDAAVDVFLNGIKRNT